MSRLIFVCWVFNFVSQIYSMESPIDTPQTRTVWGSLTLIQLSQVCCHGIYCHKCTTQVSSAICKKQVIAVYGNGRWLIHLAWAVSTYLSISLKWSLICQIR